MADDVDAQEVPDWLDTVENSDEESAEEQQAKKPRPLRLILLILAIIVLLLLGCLALSKLLPILRPKPTPAPTVAATETP
ncbi:MAG TPA: hypothetical protein ENK24_03125, partial [Anaerolineae bacterium]|nr:hypothetical protein [Anaerolineae bacterium]